MLNSDTNKTSLIPGLKLIMFCHIQLATSFKFKYRAEFRSLLKTEKSPLKKKKGAISVISGLWNLSGFTFKTWTTGYSQKAVQRGIITAMSFLPFPEHSLWVCSVQLPLSVCSATFFCAVKYISCLQRILEENPSNSSSYIGIWAYFDCPST